MPTRDGISSPLSRAVAVTVMSSSVDGLDGATEHEVTTGAMLSMVTLADSLLPVSVPSLAVSVTPTSSKWMKFELSSVEPVAPAMSTPFRVHW